MSRFRHWCFTLNNYTEDDLSLCRSLPPGSKYIVVGKEVGESGTPHLQGFITFVNARRLSSVRTALFDTRAHWENARTPWSAAKYCKKDGDFEEHGDPPLEPASSSRSDLAAFKESVKGGCLNPKRLREEFSDVYAKYPRFCSDYIRDNTPFPRVDIFELRGWQAGLVQQLDAPPDRRSIIFVVDRDGDTGKSWFCDWYRQSHEQETQILTPGKYADMAMALDTSIRVLFLDCPRSKQGDFIQYDFLENVKNGRIFSGKYESGMKYLEPVHIVVMMNEEPDLTKLSRDRPIIITINSIN